MDGKYNVSFYSNMYKSKDGETVGIESIFEDIKNEKYKKEIIRLRHFLLNGNEAEYKKRKKNLPAFTPSGTFIQRECSGLIKHSNILSIDFDGIEDAANVKAEIIKERWVLAAFISPSNNGVKVFIRINADQHLLAFNSLRNEFIDRYEIANDKACKDISRLCFVSIDKDIFINFDCEIYSPAAPLKKELMAVTFPPASKEIKQPGKSQEQIKNEVEVITERIEASQVNICKSYADRLKCGFALSNDLGEHGRNLFYRVCRFYQGDTPITPETQYNECLKQRKTGVNYQSFFYLAQNAGVDINLYKNEAPPPPVNPKVSGRFKNNYGEEITDRERIELSINEIFEVRRNIILDRIECKERGKEKSAWEQANEDDISRELELKRVKNCSPQRIKSLLNSKFVKAYNPFKQYFENLPGHNKKENPDYIQQLAEIVQLKNESEDRERFNRHFKKALVRCVACSLADEVNNLYYNKHAIIFISPNQSIGKTGFIRFLIPKDLELYCVEKMTFGNRDEQFTMQSSFIINLDEMSSIEEKNLQCVKSAMSTGVINVRKINSGQRMIEPRRCNFWGNTNQTSILKDDTGSVRWLCFEVAGFNKDAEYWKVNSVLFVDIDKVWAMAYSLFKSGFDFQLSAKEILENETSNEMYKEESIEQELIKMNLMKAERERKNLKTTSQILTIIGLRNPFLSNKLNITKVGTALKNLGFIYGQEYDKLKGFQVKGYYVTESNFQS